MTFNNKTAKKNIINLIYILFAQKVKNLFGYLSYGKIFQDSVLYKHERCDRQITLYNMIARCLMISFKWLHHIQLKRIV